MSATLMDYDFDGVWARLVFSIENIRAAIDHIGQN